MITYAVHILLWKSVELPFKYGCFTMISYDLKLDSSLLKRGKTVLHGDEMVRESCARIMFKARTSLQVRTQADFGRGSKTACVSMLAVRPEHRLAALSANYHSAQCQNTCNCHLHPFMQTHQRGRGDELSTGIHYEGTWWSGQPKELALIRCVPSGEKHSRKTTIHTHS